ncbi:retrovirus-related pol polyprotein from transposon TNT 1-94 [Tanacetum coccineum]
MSNTNTNLQTQTSNTLHNAIIKAGGKDRPPMLAPGNYVQWKSKIKRYIDTKPNNELIHYCLQNPPYKFKWTEKTVPVTEGESINVQDLETNLYWEFGKFTSREGESLKSYYSRFYKMINKLVKNQCDVTNHQVNVQFLLQLQPEWERSQQAATRNRGKAIVNSPPPTYDQEPTMVAKDDEMSKKKEIDKLMALISLSFKKIYKPTNNNLRTSSNTSRANQDNTPRINRGTRYGNQRVVNIDEARENVAREYQKLKREKDAAYHKEKMLLYQELEAHYLYMAQIQEVTPDTIDNSGPIFDVEPLQKIQNDDDNYNVYHDVNYALKVEIDCAKAKGDLMSYKMESQKSFNEYTQKINDLNQTISEMKKELIAHQETISIISLEKEAQNKFHKTREDKELEKIIALENKIKVLDDIVYKTGQSVQTMNMLNRNCKTSFVKPEFLKKAQRANTCLYDIGFYKDNLALMLAPESEEMIRLAQEITAQILPLNVKSIIKNTNVIAPGMYKVHTMPNQTRRTQLPQDIRKTNKRMSFSIGVIPTTSVSRPQLKSNQLEDRVMHNNSQGKKQQVEDHHRNFKFSNNKTSVTICNVSLNAKTSNVNFVCVTCGKCVLNDNHDMCVLHYINDVNTRTKQLIDVPMSTKEPKQTVNQSIATPLKKILVEIILFIVYSGCSKHMMGNLKLLSNFVEKFLGTVKFRNDQIAPILGYGDLVQGNLLFGSLHVTFVKGNDLLTGSRGTDLYSITLQDTSTPNLICLMAKATSSQAWLWHHHILHLNFNTINLLSKYDIVTGLPKLKFVKDHLCSSCELGKAKCKSFKTKTTLSLNRRLQILHMDLCGPMRVESFIGKKYVLVIIDDYSRYTWTHFLRSKDETPEVLIDFLKLVQRGLHAQIRTVLTDKGTKFLNKTLLAYFAQEGIKHQTLSARIPKQNGVVERRNRTLVEAARTMLSAAKVPLFF